MKELRLSLIGKWFNMTKQKVKGEDYRLPTPYWCNRLMLYKGESKSKEFWRNEVFTIVSETPQEYLIFLLEKRIVSFKNFKTNTMTLGYPNNSDTERILKLEHKGIKIDFGNPEWGAEPNKLYFVIMHGKIIQ